MARLSARTCGTTLVAAGVVLALTHLHAALHLWSVPMLMIVDAFVPLELALIVTATGVWTYGGWSGVDEFADRMLVWAGIGALVFGAAAGWIAIDAAVRESNLPAVGRMVANAATMGALCGVVVGVYDARGRHEHRRANRLTRLNDTLRIATREVVTATERDELEREVCEQLTRSELYDSVWIGRYSPGTTVVDPATWAGHDEAYIESLEVTVDPDEPEGQGPGGEAIRTGEIQPVQDVFAEPRLEPWWDLLSERGIESMAVVPFVGETDVYGFLSVYADRPNVFDAPEREALTDLGESIGNAIDSIQARDRLARRERELKRQNEQLDEFASVISHDLRNPLNVAVGNLELVQEDVSHDRLGRAATALGRMDELIDNVLRLAREGRTVSEFQPIDLQAVAESAWSTTDTGDSVLRFESHPGTVQGDEKRVVQAFENLFRNSVEHGSTRGRTQSGDDVEHGSTDGRPKADDSETPRTAGDCGSESAGSQCVEPVDGGRHTGCGGDASGTAVTVTVGPTADGFYVVDDGPGIPETDRDDVFGVGYSTNPEGTGFGLNIVRTIAEAHGWSVRAVESETGGARFEFAGVDPADAD